MKIRILTISPLVLITCTIIFLVSGCKKENNEDPAETVKDIEGNSYTVVTIGTQKWLVENLRTTKYNDGADIPGLTVDNEWVAATTGAYCWYENNSAYKSTYGALYNWFAASSGKLCPAGWHVPSKAEYETLILGQGGDVVAGGSLKEKGLAHWYDPNAGANNLSGFKALPGGQRVVSDYGTGVSFDGLKARGLWWSATPYTYPTSVPHAYYLNMWFDNTEAGFGSRPRPSGMSVRCIKD